MSNVKCPMCQSSTYDNRTSKKSPKAPDFKCSNKSCGAGGWLNKDQSAVNFSLNGSKASVSMSSIQDTPQTPPKINTYTQPRAQQQQSSVPDGIFTAWAKDLAVACVNKAKDIPSKEEVYDLVVFFHTKLSALLNGGCQETPAVVPASKQMYVATPPPAQKQVVEEAVIDSSEVNLEDFNFDDLGV